MRFLSALGTFAALWHAVSASPLVARKDDGPKTFEITLTWEKYSNADGFEREMILSNGQFPGPLMELNQGDDVVVVVHNKLPFNTTMHFHGIEMLNTPWSDGMPGLTQRHIRPGNSFTYRWTATQFGSYWYHAHQRAQIDDGFYGPIIIHPARGQAHPFEEIAGGDAAVLRELRRAEKNVEPLMLGDYRHALSEEAWDIGVAAGIEMPCYDAMLFNGKGRVDCWSQDKINSLLSEDQKVFLQLSGEESLTAKGCLSANTIASVLSPPGSVTNISSVPPMIFDECSPTNTDLEIVHVDMSTCGAAGKWVALDVIGTFGLMTAAFSIDEHPMYVYAVDGSYINPQLVHMIPVTNGDRYSVLIKIDKPGDFAIRTASLAAAQMIAGHAVFRVRNGGKPDNSQPVSINSNAYTNDVGVPASTDVVVFGPNMFDNYPPEEISATSDQEFILTMQVAGAAFNWALNSTIYPMALDSETPLLFEPDPERLNNVTITTLNNTWVDIVFVAGSAPMPPHPIHKHGNKMYAIGSGTGPFNYTSVAEAIAAAPQNFNLVNPPRRDTFATPAATTEPAWMVIRYHVNNPGPWFLHCHIESHLVGGMGVAIQDGIDAWPTVPEEYANYH